MCGTTRSIRHLQSICGPGRHFCSFRSEWGLTGPQRRERLITAAMQSMARSKWGLLHRDRALAFWGHVARQDPQEHVVARILEWRRDRGWQQYRSSSPAKAGGLRGRRPANRSLPNRAERGREGNQCSLRAAHDAPQQREGAASSSRFSTRSDPLGAARVPLACRPSAAHRPHVSAAADVFALCQAWASSADHC